MFQWILNKIAGNYNEQQLQKLQPIIQQINNIYTELDSLSDDAIKAKTQEFKDRLTQWASLDDILPEAFAVVKQACRRMVWQSFDVKWEMVEWNMVPYDVQLLGWLILHKWIIAEMKTWEGKTLVATLPAYLNALTWDGVHIVTVNDYLASRDAAWMAHLYERLWLTVGCVTKSVSLQNRREEYSKDITYVENSELWFDYLRDNLVRSNAWRNLLWRKPNYAIIDEIDSILIDEARTPLIISEPAAAATDKYGYYAHLVKSLVASKTKKKVSKWLLHELVNKGNEVEEEDDQGDYYIDEKAKTALLSSHGIAKLEKLLKVENLYQDIWYEEIHHIENALKANAVYHKDKEYIVRDGEILIVDEHTGRAMQGRRFSEWLHQAIEAKEWVTVQRESKTMATITYQNFFKQYKKLAGMTGTAVTEGEEFMKIYELEVLEIPTNRPTIRVDKNDKVYFNQRAKWKFVTEYITFAHEIGQPILIGTSSIQTSEHVSEILQSQRINHVVLNAKQHEKEADIVSNAGKAWSVMVATNMAWRGTDIKLEKGLNQTLATNYIKRTSKQLSKNNAVSAIVYSRIEYDYTIDAIQAARWLTEEQINQAAGGWFMYDAWTLVIKFNNKKKENTDAFAEIIFKPLGEQHTELIEKDFHYGLFILGTEKHDSRRIDNQLRGRAGRQWDAGFSIFFVALDDEIMRKMGGEKIQSVASMLLKKEELENLELNQSQFSSSIVRAQKQMEAMHFSVRKHLFDYDSVINKQRQRIYTKRDDILASEESPEGQTTFVQKTLEELDQYITDIVTKQINDAQAIGQWVEDLLAVITKELNVPFSSKKTAELVAMSWATLEDILPKAITQYFHKQLKGLEETKLYMMFKEIYLYHLDKLRVDHIDEMQYLREKVALMGYAQQDPLTMYKQQAYEKFQTLLYRFKFDTIASITRVDFAQLQNPQPTITLQAGGQSQQDYLNALKQAAGSQELKEMVQDIQEEQKKPKVYEDEDGFEVFEIDDKPSKSQASNGPTIVIDTNTKKKLRPNDIVTVRYSDGKITADVKYKKVKDDIDAGKAVVI